MKVGLCFREIADAATGDVLDDNDKANSKLMLHRWFHDVTGVRTHGHSAWIRIHTQEKDRRAAVFWRGVFISWMSLGCGYGVWRL